MKRVAFSFMPSLAIYCVMAFTTLEFNPVNFHEILRFWLSIGSMLGFVFIYSAPHWHWKN